MITQHSNGYRTITLGENTTQISQVIQKGKTESDGICFCNSFDENGRPSEDAVIINIVNGDGVIAYVKVLTDMLLTWKIEGSTRTGLEKLKRVVEGMK